MSDVLTPSVQGYRYKESQPKYFNTVQVMQMAKGAQYAVTNLGVPQIAIDSLPQRILQEGREDAGANTYNINNPDATKVYQQMKDAGFNTTVATYAASVLDKYQVADRLGIPFDTAWNGTGRSSDSGKTGIDYANQMLATKSVISDPRNVGFIDFIQRSATGNISSKERLSQLNPSQLVQRTYGTLDKNTDLLGNGDPDLFGTAIFQAMTKAGVTDQSIDGIRNALGPGSNYESSIADNLTSLVRQRSGIPLTDQDKNNLANSTKNPVLSNILDQLANPIVKQYKGTN